MTKWTSKTRVIINGVDMSSYLYRVDLPRIPNAAETVDLTLQITKLEIDDDGVLTIRIDNGE